MEDPRHEPLLRLCAALHGQLSELQQLMSRGAFDGVLPGERGGGRGAGLR
jgi:hypothetical protein